MLEEVFLGLQSKVMVVGAPFKHFDWYNEQYEVNELTQKTNAPFAMPAVFVEFLPFTPKNLGRKKQIAEIIFRLHLVTQNYAFSQYGHPQQAQALNHLSLANALYKAIHGCNCIIPANVLENIPARVVFNTCSRQNNDTDHRQTNLVVNIQQFRTVAYDYGAVRATQTIITPPLGIQETIV